MGSRKSRGKQIRSCLVLISLAIFVYMYFVKYKDMKTDLANLDQALAVVRQQTEERQNILSQAEGMETNIQALQESMQGILQKYPSELTMPEALLFLQKFEDENTIQVVASSISDIIPFYDTTVPGRMIDPNAPQEVLTNMRGIKCDIAISYQANYNDLKQCMKYIEMSERRVTLNGISMSYDTSTGTVTGNMSLSLYAIEGSGVPVEQPVLEDIPIGKTVIFE